MMLRNLAPLLLCATAHGAIYSQYSLDEPTVTDKFGLTNSDKNILLGSGDNAVCGSSYHMKANDFITLGSSNGAPTGNVDFSVGGYVKPVTLANRALFAIGGNFKDTDGSVGNWGAWVMVDSKGSLSVRTLKLNQKSSATIVVGKWSQVLLTYTASETVLRLWVDGVLALSHEVTMDLRKNSRYGGMAIGEYHLGGSPWGRGGEYFMDHVSFANTVLTSTEARAPCVGIYSQYSLDGPTVTDKFGLTNSDKKILLGSGDNAVCGSSYHMKANDFITLGSSNGAPTGNVDFSVGGYVKPVTLANRALFAIGGNFKDTDGSVGNWGAWVMVDSKGSLSVRTLKLNQKSSATIVVGKWSQVLLTYTASETVLRLWVDGVLALSHEVTMDLRKNSRYGGMAIGEYHLGGSPWGRGGEYFMDHVSFSKFVMTEKDARAPCLNAPPTSAPPTPAPATSAPPTSAPPTSAPPTSAPPTSAPPTSAPPTSAPPTPSPTPVCTDGTGWTDSHGHMCAFYILSAVRDALYNETLGGIFSTWTGDDPCVWGGVECYDGEFVFRLNLANAETLAAVVPDLSRLTRMVELNVRGTQITGFAALPASLLDLDFSFTQINGPMPSAATTAKRYVGARSAGLTGELPDFLDGMREIDVSFNSMEGPFPSLPADLINFIAQNNKFTGPLPECESCIRVLVNNNELTGSLRAYPNLWTGHFQYNFLSGGLDLSLSPTATYIDVTRNMLTGTLTNLQDAGLKIQTLKLGHNEFSGSFPFAPVSPGRVLLLLEVNYNQLTGAEPSVHEADLVAASVVHDHNSFGM